MRLLIVLPVLVFGAGLLVSCEKKEPNEQKPPVIVQTQEPSETVKTYPEIAVQAEEDSTGEQKTKTDAEQKAQNDAEWREIESAMSKLTSEEIEVLDLEGWVGGIKKHNALKKLSDKEIELLQIEVRPRE